MRILAIETTGPFCSVVLAEGSEIVQERASTDELNHLRSLMPMIRDMGAGLCAPDLIAVSSGPGSFTGIRIGVSSARALAQAAGVKLMAAPTLDAFGIYGCDADAGEIVCPFFDARREQVYAGAYEAGRIVVAAGAYMLDEFLELLPQGKRPVFIGDGHKSYGAKVRELIPNAKVLEEYQHARNIALWAAEHFEEELLLDYNDLKPNYMRMAEAERKLRIARGK